MEQYQTENSISGIGYSVIMCTDPFAALSAVSLVALFAMFALRANVALEHERDQI